MKPNLFEIILDTNIHTYNRAMCLVQMCNIGLYVCGCVRACVCVCPKVVDINENSLSSVLMHRLD